MDKDYELVKGCKNNDPAAFEKLYEKYASQMKGVAYRYVNDYTMAEDIIQEAFIKVFMKINEFDLTRSFNGWLHRVVVNSAIDKFHNLREIDANITNLDDMEDDDHPYNQEEDNEYTMEELVESISQLPEKHRLVFNMFVVDEFSHKEIAAALNITENTSKSQLSRAREYLKKILEKHKSLTNAR